MSDQNEGGGGGNEQQQDAIEAQAGDVQPEAAAEDEAVEPGGGDGSEPSEE